MEFVCFCSPACRATYITAKMMKLINLDALNAKMNWSILEKGAEKLCEKLNRIDFFLLFYN